MYISAERRDAYFRVLKKRSSEFFLLLKLGGIIFKPLEYTEEFIDTVRPWFLREQP